MKEKDSNTRISSAARSASGFGSLFAAVLRRERRRALAASCCVWGITALIAAGLYALADVYSPLENETRRGASALLAVLLLILLAVLLVRAWRRNPADVARKADAANRDVRKTVLACWEMERNAPSSRLLGAWLARETERAACTRLEQYAENDRLWHLLKRKSVWGLLLLLALCLGLVSWDRDAAGVLYGRLCTPWKDIPPLSPYRFELVDSPSSVVYGEDALMQVRVTGAPLAAPVEIWIKPDGHPVQKLAAFRDQSGIWARRLETLTAPCRIAFATGNARSAWHSLEINYQPKVVNGAVSVSPPEYIGHEVVEYPLNGQDVTVIDGGTADFMLKSNRPLMSGKAVFTPDRKDLEPQNVQGILLPDGRISFPFRVRQSGTASIQIMDYRGTAMARPLENRIRVNADARPSVVIHEPKPVTVALEGVVLPFHVEIQDDYGVTHAAWVRSVNDSRARSLDLPVPQESRKSLFLAEQISLPAIGARAGDVLQLAVEARDANPYLLNMTVSEPVTVHVIHEDQYREMLRVRTEVMEFLNKYRLLAQSIDELVKELDKAAEASPSGLSRGEAARLKEKHAEVRKLAEKMARDFPIFDTDGKLSETAAALAGVIRENEDDLSGELPGSPEAARQFFRTMRGRLRAPQQEMSRQQGEAEMVAAIMKGYELILEFQRLAASQKETATMLERFVSEGREGRTVTPEQLKALGEAQKETLARYWLWLTRAPSVIAAIPAEAQEFKEKMEGFLHACFQSGIAEVMEGCASSCSRGKAREAASRAAKAWEIMMKLLGEDPAAQQCMQGGACPVSGLSRESAAAMQQLLNSMLCRQRGTGGFGSGEGTGGDGGMNNAPMFGPQREKFRQARPSRAGAGQDPGQGEGEDRNAEKASRPVRERKDGDNSPAQEKTPGGALGSPAMQRVPDLYRDAVRQYFEQHRQNQPQP